MILLIGLIAGALQYGLNLYWRTSKKDAPTRRDRMAALGSAIFTGALVAFLSIIGR